MSELESWEKKCDMCGEWTDGNKYVCSHCGEIMEEEHHEQALKRESQSLADLGWVHLHDDDHFFVRIIKRIILTVQVIYFGLLSFFIWLIAFLSS